MKNVLKVYPFFSEKRNTKKCFFFLLLLLCVFLFPKNTQALSVSDWGTQQFTDDFTECLERVFTFDAIAYWNAQTTTTPTTSNNIAVCLFYEDDIWLENGNTAFANYRVNGVNSLQYYKWGSGWNNMKCFLTRIDNCNSEPETFNITSSIIQMNSNSSLPFASNKQYFSSINIAAADGTNYSFTKNTDYTPPSCEECEECPSGGQEGECGPVEVSNFPISETEFYCLLVLLGVLIIMLLFKWLFPMKGGKKL